LVLGSLGVGVFAVILNQVILRPFIRRGSPLLFLLIVTFGLSLILSNSVLAVWGSNFEIYNLPSSSNAINIGPMIFTPEQLAIIGIAVVVMLAVHILLTQTKIGKAMRARSAASTPTASRPLPGWSVGSLPGWRESYWLSASPAFNRRSAMNSCSSYSRPRSWGAWGRRMAPCLARWLSD